MLGDAPSKIVSVQVEPPVEPVNAVSIYKGKQNKERQFDQHQQVTRPEKEKQEGDWRNRFNFNQKPDDY